MADIKQEYTGTWIPAAVMLCKDLKPIEKLVYAEIASFNDCWASNAWIAERVGIGERSVTSAIKHLKELEFIVVTETKAGRSCVASQNLRGGSQNLRGGVAKFAIKNNNIEQSIKQTHTSTLRDDDSAASPSLPATSVEDDGNKDGPTESAARAEHLRKVFDAIVAITHPGQKIMYTSTRQAHLRARLKNFKPSQLVEAAKNLMASPWHIGDNPQNKKYATYDFLVRKDEKVEEWLNNKPVKKQKSVF